MVIAAAEDRPAGLGQAQAVAGAVEVLHEVAEARVDVGGELDVIVADANRRARSKC